MPAHDWLKSGAALPRGGVRISTIYERGTQTSVRHFRVLSPVLEPLFGSHLHEGSLNLRATKKVALPDPQMSILEGRAWCSVPVIIGDSAIGIVARTQDSGDTDFLEIIGPYSIAERLRLTPGARVDVRLQSGRDLFQAA